MAIKDLEAMITERANTNAQAKIDQFKKDIETALDKLLGQTGYRSSFGSYHAYLGLSHIDPDCGLSAQRASVLSLALNNKDDEKKNLHWPAPIWRNEEESIRKELLSKMDLMQQLLMQPKRDTSNDVPMP